MFVDKRIKWVDSAKGICVLLVIIGHFLYGSSHKCLNTVIYSFHVPAFFLLSGFVYKWRGWKEIIKKAKKLLVPYFIFSFLSLGRALEALNQGDITFSGLIQKLFYHQGEVFFNYPLWFLIVLFEIYLIELFVNSTSRSIYTNYGVMLVTIGISFYFYYYDTDRVFDIFGVNRTMVAYGFFQAGIILKRRATRADFKKHSSKMIDIIVMLISGTACCIIGTLLNEKTSLYPYSLGNLSFFYLAAFLGIISLLKVSVLFLNKDCWIGRLSKYSILFLGIQFYISDWYIELMIQKSLQRTWKFDVGMILIIVLFVVAVPVIYDKTKRVFKPIALLNGEI